jgi:glycosyltransferase involved in cell wall biosynthesis
MKSHGLPFPATLVTAPSDEQLAELFRRATVFVFPSLFEGFGLPPLEAMACGTPVVTTACGGVSDFARDGENCLMVPPGDVEGMAQAILRLLGDSPLRRRLSDTAVETARPWTWVRAVDQTEYYLRQVLQGHCLI